MTYGFHVFNADGMRLSMWFKDGIDPDMKHRFIISCHGLPSHPYQHNPAKMERLLDEGYILVFPNYIGTWASDGHMTWENCVRTITGTIGFLESGKARKVGQYTGDGSIIRWKVHDISLLGGSFGGSVALVAGAKSGVQNIIAIAAPTDWRNHSRIPEESAEPIEDLYDAVMEGWGNLWRIPREEWDRLVDGSCDLNPIDYADVLKGKRVMLIHGEADEVVSVKRSRHLHELLADGDGKHELLVLDGEGHKGSDLAGRSDIFSRVHTFLSE